MLYDVDVHLYKLMEALINDFHEGEVEKLIATETMISKIVDGSKLKTELKTIMEIRETETNKLFKQSFEMIRQALDTKKGLEVFVAIERIKEKLSKDLQKIENDSWETVFAKIVKYIKSVEKNEG